MKKKIANFQSKLRYDIIRKHTIGTTLDVGCGTFKPWMTRCCDIDCTTDMRIDHVDLDKELPYDNNEFNTVICAEVLEHIYRPSLALHELKRVAQKRIIITIPREPHFSIVRMLCLRGWHPEHRWALTPQVITDILELKPIIQKPLYFRWWLLVYNL